MMVCDFSYESGCLHGHFVLLNKLSTSGGPTTLHKHFLVSLNQLFHHHMYPSVGDTKGMLFWTTAQSTLDFTAALSQPYMACLQHSY